MSVPAEHWNSPLFLSVNKAIIALWAAALTVTGVGSALLHHYQPDNGTARTALAIARIALPVLFTVRYPGIACALPCVATWKRLRRTRYVVTLSARPSGGAGVSAPPSAA